MTAAVGSIRPSAAPLSSLQGIALSVAGDTSSAHLPPPILLDLMVAVVKQRGLELKKAHFTTCRRRNSFAIRENISLPFSAPI